MSQIKKNGLENNAVDDTKIRLRNNQMLRARNAAGSADVNVIKLNASDEIEFPTQPVYNGSPLATQSDVVVAAQGLLPKDAVRASTTTVLPTCTYNNGTAGVGATLTGDANGALAAIDGITLIVDDRVLVKNQAAGLQNGIYIVTQVGDGSNPFILTRATDFDDSPDGEIRVGANTYTYSGTTNSGKTFVVTTATNITVGTDAIVFGLSASSTSSVDTVNGQTGTVILTTDNIAEGATNKYFTSAAAKAATVADGITDGITDVAPSQNAVFDALALKEDAANVAADARTAVITSSITNGDTTHSPSGDAVFDALALKQNSLNNGAEQLTLNGTDITNQYKDLAQTVINGSLVVEAFGVIQTQGVDYTLSVVSSKTRITFAGDLATGGNAALISTDKLNVQYLY